MIGLSWRQKPERPRYYVFRVTEMALDTGTPIAGDIMVDVGSFTYLSTAWTAARNVWRYYGDGNLYVAGMMGSLIDNKSGAPAPGDRLRNVR